MVDHCIILIEQSNREFHRLPEGTPIQLAPRFVADLLMQKHPPHRFLHGDDLPLSTLLRKGTVTGKCTHLPDGGLRIGCFAQRLQRLDGFGGKQIVTVHKGKELAVSLHEPHIPGIGQAAIFLMEHANALILCRIFLAECTALIRGSVIDQ